MSVTAVVVDDRSAVVSVWPVATASVVSLTHLPHVFAHAANMDSCLPSTLTLSSLVQ